MTKEIIVFNADDKVRHILVSVLKIQAGTGPTIDININDIGDQSKVTAPDSAKACNFIAAYEFNKKYYILLGLDKVNYASLDGKIRVKLITRHMIKKSEPLPPGAQLVQDSNFNPVQQRRGYSDRPRNNGFENRFNSDRKSRY